MRKDGEIGIETKFFCWVEVLVASSRGGRSCCTRTLPGLKYVGFFDNVVSPLDNPEATLVEGVGWKSGIACIPLYIDFKTHELILRTQQDNKRMTTKITITDRHN